MSADVVVQNPTQKADDETIKRILDELKAMTVNPATSSTMEYYQTKKDKVKYKKNELHKNHLPWQSLFVLIHKTHYQMLSCS